MAFVRRIRHRTFFSPGRSDRPSIGFVHVDPAVGPVEEHQRRSGLPAREALDAANSPKPGEGPSKEERETGFYDAAFIGIAADGRKVRVAVKGDKDPGYGSTSKMIAETAICLVNAPDIPGGVWVPGAALGNRLIERLQKNAGLSFEVEA